MWVFHLPINHKEPKGVKLDPRKCEEEQFSVLGTRKWIFSQLSQEGLSNAQYTAWLKLKEAFLIYDQDRDQKVNRSQCTDIIRSIGLCPKEDDLVQMLGERDRLFSIDELQQIIQTKCPPPESEDTLREAFRTFDRDGNGFIDAREIRHVLCHLGEKLKDDEVDEMLRESDISGDNMINYEELMRKILSLSN